MDFVIGLFYADADLIKKILKYSDLLNKIIGHVYFFLFESLEKL
jgi:hypothetical protein